MSWTDWIKAHKCYQYRKDEETGAHQGIATRAECSTYYKTTYYKDNNTMEAEVRYFQSMEEALKWCDEKIGAGKEEDYQYEEL